MYAAGTYASMRASTRTGRVTRRVTPCSSAIGLVQHLDVQLEAERGNVARLLGAEQVACAADLEVAHRDREARAELGVVGQRRQSRTGLRGELGRVRIEEVGVRELTSLRPTRPRIW